MKRCCIFIVIAVLCTSFLTPLSAQNTLRDSLYAVLTQPNLTDTSRALVLADLAIALRNTNADSSKSCAEEVLKISKKYNFTKGEGRAYQALGIYHYIRGEYETALGFYQKAQKCYQTANYLSGVAWSYTNIGSVYRNFGNYDKALSAYEESLTIFEQIQELPGMGWAYGNISLIHSSQNNYEQAEQYAQKSLKVRQKYGYLPDIAQAYNHVADIAQKQRRYQEAAQSYQQAIALYERVDDKVNASKAYRTLGLISLSLEQDSAAQAQLEQSLALGEKMNSAILTCEAQTALAQYYLKKNEKNKALQMAEKALTTAQKIGQREALSAAAYTHSQVAFALRDFEKAYQSLALYKTTEDSLRQEQFKKQALQQDFQYQLKLQTAEEERKRLLLENQVQRQKYWLYGVVGGFLSILLLTSLAFRAYRQKQKDNQLLAIQQQEIVAQNEELRQNQEELMLLNEGLNEQKNTLELVYTQLKNTTGELGKSIRYASRMQDLILAERQALEEFFGEVFLIYKPRNIVSGDFYWFHQFDQNRAILAVADCTGHGVPGAFMSMLGASLLYQEVAMGGNSAPEQILQHLHKGIQNILKQHLGHNNDGMDISIGLFEKQADGAMQLTFAGAKTQIYYQQDKALERLQGDKTFIGGPQQLEKHFQAHSVLLQPQTMVYFFSDGLIDQNNHKRKRLGIKRFEETLTTHLHEPANVQKNALDAALNDHQGQEEQRDDITVLGLRV